MAAARSPRSSNTASKAACSHTPTTSSTRAWIPSSRWSVSAGSWTSHSFTNWLAVLVHPVTTSCAWAIVSNRLVFIDVWWTTIGPHLQGSRASSGLRLRLRPRPRRASALGVVVCVCVKRLRWALAAGVCVGRRRRRWASSALGVVVRVGVVVGLHVRRRRLLRWASASAFGVGLGVGRLRFRLTAPEVARPKDALTLSGR